MFKNISVYLTGHDLAKHRGGLGPNSFGYWRILLPYSGLFYEPSIEHDLLYCIGGNKKDLNEANEIFLTKCMIQSKTGTQRVFAFIYYIIVERYGKKYFNFTEK